MIPCLCFIDVCVFKERFFSVLFLAFILLDEITKKSNINLEETIQRGLLNNLYFYFETISSLVIKPRLFELRLTRPSL